MRTAIYVRVSTVTRSQQHTIEEQINRLRGGVRLGDYDRVLVTSPDRLARNYVHRILLLEELERADCAVEFLDQPAGDTPHDHLLLQIRGAVAEYEGALIGERMRRGRLARYRAGLLLPRVRPVYSYLLDPERTRDPRACASRRRGRRSCARSSPATWRREPR